MTIPKDVHDSLSAAEALESGKFPTQWQFPDSEADKANAVWDALKPARDYLGARTGKPVGQIAGESTKDLIVGLRYQIFEETVPGAGKARKKPVDKI